MLKKTLISLLILSTFGFSLVSCKDEEKDKDDFSVSVNELSSSTAPFDDADEPKEESSQLIVMQTTVYENMQDAYMSMVNGEEEKWEKYRETMYVLLADEFGATDTDGDGLPDDYEIEVIKTDPDKADTDGDGYDDCVEDWMQTDPNTYND